MKRIACVVFGLAVAASSSGCCCLSHLFGYPGGYGYGNNCQPMMAPQGGCYSGQCGYGPGAMPYQMGPTGYAPMGTTASVVYPTPVYATINPAPVY